MLVSEILARKGNYVFTSRPDTNIKDLTTGLHERRIGSAVIVDIWGSTIGIITERDIVYGIATRGKAVLELGAGELMTSSVAICSPDQDLSDVMAILTHRRVRHIVVMDDGELSGIVSIGDVVKHRLDDMQLEVNVLRDYARISRP